MLAITVKNVIVLIFLFAVLERMGVQLVSFTMQFGNYNPVEFVDHPENTSKESEKEKDTVKEFCNCTGFKPVSDIIRGVTSSQKLFINANIIHSYYPSVPTPPPNGADASYSL